LKPLVLADLERDGEPVREWEYDLLVALIGTEAQRTLERQIKEFTDRQLERLGIPVATIIDVPVSDPGVHIEDIAARIPSELRRARSVDERPPKKYYDQMSGHLCRIRDTRSVHRVGHPVTELQVGVG
jgi:hypothetical protein